MDTVLIVDDEQGMLNLLSRMLTDAGYRVQTADTGRAAMDLAAANPFDMALIDIFLPDMDGTDLLARLKEACPDMAMIIITGKPSLENVVASLRQGAFDYLEKPLEREVVLNALGNAGTIKRLRDEKGRLTAENRAYQESLERMVKEKTAALEESEKAHRDLVETMHEGLAVQDPEGRLTYVNSRSKPVAMRELAEGVREVLERRDGRMKDV